MKTLGFHGSRFLTLNLDSSQLFELVVTGIFCSTMQFHLHL